MAGHIVGYVYRIPKAKTVDWDAIKRVLARPTIASSLPIIRKIATRADYDKLWNTDPSTTTRRLKQLVRRGVLQQSYNRMRHETGLSSVAAFYAPAKSGRR